MAVPQVEREFGRLKNEYGLRRFACVVLSESRFTLNLVSSHGCLSH
jgi:hypothetical protein